MYSTVKFTITHERGVSNENVREHISTTVPVRTPRNQGKHDNLYKIALSWQTVLKVCMHVSISQHYLIERFIDVILQSMGRSNQTIVLLIQEYL